MKVADLFKHRGETITKQHSEFMQWMTPTVKEYWGEIVNKAHNRHLFTRLRDFQAPAVNDEVQPLVQQPKPIELKPEAQKLYLELQAKLGEVIHTGEWLDISQERINQFGQVTEDMQWIHTDPERAEAESPFKTTIAHGFLTLALLPKLTDSVDPDNNLFPTAKMVVNIGLNQVRFPYPVKTDNKVRAVSTLSKVTPIRKGLEVEREIKVEIEGVRRPGAVVTSVIQLHF
ncbi:MaoC family dehydratase [Vibrio europaeus]|uniref:MaoC family dehydratase n=1 Tax=Vibrio europaeus TaxID=300876 RepID=UPI0018A76393|nr:MaoC family dehydratase [Vibrio europaeus]MDC5719820.1 MaoC family dehydratase [Vibrio europaeus]MDC5756555.1 MaoC family dehydratase [Vibrio europaeus]MDC5775095.1 MaoC family dehydratase [Vibrio europaeus]MDC5794233.1 MaoC family dehydratase [Vibrio europaeus]MDC5800504.1 MaoC family dehydratase [Vibrio europaeus]